jgi:hypothetical protein
MQENKKRELVNQMRVFRNTYLVEKVGRIVNKLMNEKKALQTRNDCPKQDKWLD